MKHRKKLLALFLLCCALPACGEKPTPPKVDPDTILPGATTIPGYAFAGCTELA